MTSVIPLIARMSTSSATLKAAFNARRGTSSRSLSFGITTTVSAKLRSFSRPYSAFSARIAPSARNGKVQIAIVRAPASFDSWASTGAPPVPVPPPRPQVMNTMSAPWTTDRSSSAASRADSSPTWGRAPAPRPRVTRRPRSNLCGDRMMSRCWASVFAAYSSAPTMPDSTRRSIVLQPPPPIPTILMFVRRLARIRSSSASSAPTPIDWVGDSGARVSAPDRVTISLTMESMVRPPGTSLPAGE